MESVVSFTFPLASIVIVLFLLWNDLLRRRRALRPILFLRATLCLLLAGVLVFNWMAFRSRMGDLPLVFVLLATVVSTLAAGWFIYRGIRGDHSFVSREEPPLPKIFESSRETPPENEERTDE
ncbi:MAG: hypothetical protein R3338_01295 [Thermoanaerobaculia bacterium]|nr:hypothetical protein [Thermoanaerobaculia bacterium]